MSTKFELNPEQQARLEAWFKHHWDVVHAGFKPRDMSGFCLWYMFGPTSMGNNVKTRCVWCADDNPRRDCNLTIDEDYDGSFIVEYDEDWF